MGHALQRELLLSDLGLEEDAADGFAPFYTVNEAGPEPSLAAALLFDELARTEGKLTLELKAHFRGAFKDRGDENQENARDQLIAERKAFAEQLDKLRRGP
ncbi:hypothetical protein AB0B01_23970 [Streptomyces sp. NPDC044571]|uniref:hypothetical protein n=1 Tax=Streptomyces sp. NPDC044571 TaxID=3155371 RepID=UPI003400E83F